MTASSANDVLVPTLEDRFVAEVQQVSGIVKKLARLYSADLHSAEDLEQEILLQAWRAFPGFRKEARFATWLYRKGVHVALTWTRTQTRRSEREARFGASLIAGGVEPLSPATEKLYAANRLLSPVERSLITLHLEGYKNPEIADLLGLTAGAIATRITRIRQRLQEILVPSTTRP